MDSILGLTRVVFQLIPKEIWGFFCDIFRDIRKNMYICTNLLI